MWTLTIAAVGRLSSRVVHQQAAFKSLLLHTTKFNHPKIMTAAAFSSNNDDVTTAVKSGDEFRVPVPWGHIAGIMHHMRKN